MDDDDKFFARHDHDIDQRQRNIPQDNGVDFDKAAREIEKQNRLDEQNLIVSERDRWAALQRDKERDIQRYGENNVNHIYALREADLIKEINQDREKVREKYANAYEKLIEEPVPKPESTKEVEPEQTQSYKDKVLQLKKEREQFMRDHFDEMASIARDPNIPPEEIKYFIDRNVSHMTTMAQSHYKQLLDHEDNPYYKQSLKDLQREQEQEKARELQGQQQIEQQQQDRWAKAAQQYEQNKKMTQEQSH